MVKKLIFGAFLLAFGLWLVVRPQVMAGLSWRDCVTLKGVVCIPKPAEDKPLSPCGESRQCALH
jgi:hypothetical protein